MPGFILEERTLTPKGRVLKLGYDPTQLNEDFSNIDSSARHTCESGVSDEVFISVLLSGAHASGQRVYAAKLLTLVSEDIHDLN